MIKKRMMGLCMFAIALTTGSGSAEPICFSGPRGNGDWFNPLSWDKGIIPGEADEARIPAGCVLKITNLVTVGYFRNGTEGTGTAKTIIDGGTLVTVGTVRYNSASYIVRGSIIVQNGGSALFNSRFIVGFEDTQGGSVTIHDGTLRVVNVYHHNETYTGREFLDTRTTLNSGGLLDVNDLMLNAGILDIAGGTLIIRRNADYEVDQWVAEGRIIPMGGKPGWKIKASFDEASGWTTVVAEPVTEPFTVGRLKPVVSFPLAI